MVHPMFKKDYKPSGLYILNSIIGMKSHFSVGFEFQTAVAMKTSTNISERSSETIMNFDAIHGVFLFCFPSLDHNIITLLL